MPYARGVAWFLSVPPILLLCVSTKPPSFIESLCFRFELTVSVLRFLSFESDCNTQVFLNAYFHFKKIALESCKYGNIRCRAFFNLLVGFRTIILIKWPKEVSTTVI